MLVAAVIVVAGMSGALVAGCATSGRPPADDTFRATLAADPDAAGVDVAVAEQFARDACWTARQIPGPYSWAGARTIAREQHGWSEAQTTLVLRAGRDAFCPLAPQP